MNLRRWLGPLGRYRPGFFRRDMASGFVNCDRMALPGWLRLPLLQSPEEKLLCSLPLTGKVVYDIGAHRGSYALFFSRKVGARGTVVAFEPAPRNFEKLARNLALNHIINVRALELALGAEREVRDVFALPGMSTTASLATDAHTPFRRRVGRAQVERLDDLVKRLELPPPDFVKIDVEGFELDVLRGACGTLARYGPDLMVEIHGASLALKVKRVAAISELLRPLGYRLIHTESGRDVHPAANGVAAGHLFGRRIAVPG